MYSISEEAGQRFIEGMEPVYETVYEFELDPEQDSDKTGVMFTEYYVIGGELFQAHISPDGEDMYAFCENSGIDDMDKVEDRIIDTIDQESNTGRGADMRIEAGEGYESLDCLPAYIEREG